MNKKIPQQAKPCADAQQAAVLKNDIFRQVYVLAARMEAEADVVKVIGLRPFSPGRFLYLVETPLEYPRFTVGTTDAELERVVMFMGCGEYWLAAEEYKRACACVGEEPLSRRCLGESTGADCVAAEQSVWQRFLQHGLSQHFFGFNQDVMVPGRAFVVPVEYGVRATVEVTLEEDTALPAPLESERWERRLVPDEMLPRVLERLCGRGSLAAFEVK